MLKKYLILMWLVVLSSLCYAVELNTTTIESTGLNTNISINQSIFFDILDLQDTYISFTNLNDGGIKCYQESSYISNQKGTDGPCGLKYGGSLTLTNDWGNISDGDWETFTSKSNGYTDIYYEYPTEVSINGSLWQVKDSCGIRNISLSTVRKNNYQPTKIYLIITSVNDTGQVIYRWSPTDNGGWTTLDTCILGADVYEESMWWYFPQEETISFSITASNRFYYVNASRFDLPYFSSSSSTNKVVTSLYQQSATVRFNAQCSARPSGSDTSSILYTPYGGTAIAYSYREFTCNGDGTISLTVTLNAGTNSFALSSGRVNDAALNSGCTDTNYMVIGGLLLLLVGVIVAGAWLLIQMAEGSGDVTSIIVTIVMMIGLGIVVIIGIYLFGNLHGVLC